MSVVIYTLCAITSLVCAVLLLRAYQANHYRLLFWASIFFGGVTINNIFLILDKLVYTELDLLVLRLIVMQVALVSFIYGLIFDE
jgi:hypothetical protein